MSQQGPERPPETTPAPGSRARAVSWTIAAIVALALTAVYAGSALSSALIFIVILLVLVIVHEFAHFATAKLFGVYVHEFGVGFPPRAFGFQFGETLYSVNWLPIGGFVRLEGEEYSDHPRSFSRKPAWQRFIILVSGALSNLILPIFLLSAALMFPHEEAVGRAVVADIVEGAPAAEAGFEPGDVIVTIDGRDAKNVNEAGRLIRLHLGDTVDITVLRDGREVTLPVEARWAPPEGQGPTGIAISAQYTFTETVSVPPWEAIPQGAQMTWDTLILARNEIISWFRGSGGPEFAGPVGIAQTTGEVARASGTAEGAVSPLLELAALLSINLGILNLLPLPMLDGGRVLFVVIEVLRGGRRIAPEKEAIVHLVGFAAFIALAVVITFADISRIWSGDSIIR